MLLRSVRMVSSLALLAALVFLPGLTGICAAAPRAACCCHREVGTSPCSGIKNRSCCDAKSGDPTATPTGLGQRSLESGPMFPALPSTVLACLDPGVVLQPTGPSRLGPAVPRLDPLTQSQAFLI